MRADYIRKVLSKTKTFIGTYPRDMLPKQVPWPCSLIINTDVASEPGQHWIAVFINDEGFGEYMDSYGFPPLYEEFYYFFNNCTTGYIFNRKQLQCLTCVTCGDYCVVFIIMRTNGITFNEFFRLFTNNQLQNDILIKKYLSAHVH